MKYIGMRTYSFSDDTGDAQISVYSICGQVAEHKSEKAQEHGKAEDTIVSALTMEEQKQLQTLLTKLQEQWLKDHAAHHKK